MKYVERFSLREVAGEHIVVKCSEKSTDMTSVIAFNECACLLYNELKGSDFGLDDMVKVILDNYEVDEATARADAQSLVEKLEEQGLLVR